MDIFQPATSIFLLLFTFLEHHSQNLNRYYFYKQNSSVVVYTAICKPFAFLSLKLYLYIMCSNVFPQVFSAMNLQLHSYNTYRRHAKAFIEPAIIHTWNSSQREMLSQPQPETGMILGGDMRADSPGNIFSSGYNDYNTRYIVFLSSG